MFKNIYRKASKAAKINKIYSECYQAALRNLSVLPGFNISNQDKILIEALTICSERLLEQQNKSLLAIKAEISKAANQ